MRRKPGTILPLELAILEAGMLLHSSGQGEFHGFMLAKEMLELGDAKRLTAYGTLYKALDRLASAGLVESRWEEPELAARENRPRRRLYHVTAQGSTVVTATGPGRNRQPSSLRVKPSTT